MSFPAEFEKFIKTKITIQKDESYIKTFTIIPTDENGMLYKKYKNLPDDNTYTIYPELVKLVPRGFSIFYSKDDYEICKLDGLEKFDGMAPFDNDDIESNIFVTNLNNKIQKWINYTVEFQEKANGKMAIFKIFKKNDKYFIFGGSKNIHIVVGIDDIIRSDNLHDKIIKQVQKDIKLFDIDTLLDKTIIGEYVDGEHIVYCEEPYIVYFTDVMKNINEIYPIQTTLPTLKQLNDIRGTENIEGVVIIYTNLDTGIVLRQKHKTIWYTLLRVMRESLKRYKKSVDNDIIYQNVLKIFKKRSDDFLNLNEHDFTKWSEILMNFIIYIKNSEYDFIDIARIGMAKIYNNFNNIKIDKIENKSNKSNNFEENLVIPNLLDYVKNLYKNSINICIVLRGPSGSGKTSMINRIECENLQVFSTDKYFMKDGEYEFNFSKLTEYHNKNLTEFKKAVDNKIKSICIDNTNISRNDYIEYINYAKNNEYVTVVFDFIKLSAEILTNRSTHNLDVVSISKKLNLYKYSVPNYYGIFICSDKLKNILNIIQKTPLHITLFYGKEIYSKKCKDMQIGREFKILIKNEVFNRAGRYLDAKIEEIDITKNFHFTIETYDGFKPVDVGTNEIIKKVALDIEVMGVYGPIY